MTNILTSFRTEIISPKNDLFGWWKGLTKCPFDLKKIKEQESVIYYSEGWYKEQRAYKLTTITKDTLKKQGLSFVYKKLEAELLHWCIDHYCQIKNDT